MPTISAVRPVAVTTRTHLATASLLFYIPAVLGVFTAEIGGGYVGGAALPLLTGRPVP